MNNVDYVSTAIEIAKEAGETLRRFQEKGFQVEYKGDFDVVTAADRAAEEVVVTHLKSRFPNHSIVAEEGGGVDRGSEYVWHVDPLDGTTNFAHGLPQFAVSIGLEKNGESVAGVVYNPIYQELFAAERGGGAYLNNRRIRVSRIERFENGLYSTGFPPSSRTRSPNFFYFQQMAVATHGTRRIGSAALDICSVASGRLEGFWEIGLKSWDVAGGLPVLLEAGGRVSDMHGAGYRSGGPHVLVTNGLLHEPLLDMFARIRAGDLPAPLPAAPSPED